MKRIRKFPYSSGTDMNKHSCFYHRLAIKYLDLLEANVAFASAITEVMLPPNYAAHVRTTKREVKAAIKEYSEIRENVD